MVKKNKLIIWTKTVDRCLLSVDLKIMKKTLLLTLALMLTSMAFAQSHVYLYEGFDSDKFPEGWSTSAAGKDNWVISKSANAGGEANEMQFAFMPPLFNATSRLITPALNVKDASEVVVSFKHCLDSQINTYTLGIATSLDTVNWNVAWEQQYETSDRYEVFEIVSTPDLGNERVYFCLFFIGSSFTLNGWYFDDFIISSQENIDLGMTSIDIPEMSHYGEHEVSFTVQNIGSEPISSFEAKYTINNKVFTETFNTNIETLDFQQFTFSEKIYIKPGDYKAKVEIISVNGQKDSNESNNIIEKNIATGMGYASKIPMIEHFSSSTCPPCVSANSMMLQVENENPGKYTYTKYPVKWPGLGDPYATNECKTRVDYYEVQNAPELYLDGISQGYSVVTPEALNAAYGTPTYADIRGAFKVEGNIITVTADFMSYITMNNVRAYISVNEKTTTGNVGTNGEKEFHHITMKMLNDSEGNSINIKAGEHTRLELSYDMEKSHMEEINDLEVALWLQNHETKEIYNSRFAYEYTDHCYPVQNMKAIEILDCTGAVEISWEAPEKGNPIGYNIYINGELIAENDANKLDFHSEDPQLIEEVRSGRNIAEVVAVYENNRTSVSVAKVLNGIWENIEENLATDNIKVYPNPVNDRLYIEAEAEINEVVVYDIYGRVQNLKISETQKLRNSIDISSLKSGFYFVKINTEKGNIVKRIIKN